MALKNVINSNLLNALWENGILPLKTSIADKLGISHILRTKEEFDANTNENNIPGALLMRTELQSLSNKIQSFENTKSEIASSGLGSALGLAASNTWAQIVTKLKEVVNRGAVIGIISTSGGQYTIPEGFHNGSGKVTGPTLENLIGTNVTASSASHVLQGHTAYGKNGVKLIGTNKGYDAGVASGREFVLVASQENGAVNVAYAPERFKPPASSYYMIMFTYGAYSSSDAGLDTVFDEYTGFTYEVVKTLNTVPSSVYGAHIFKVIRATTVSSELHDDGTADVVFKKRNHAWTNGISFCAAIAKSNIVDLLNFMKVVPTYWSVDYTFNPGLWYYLVIAYGQPYTLSETVPVTSFGCTINGGTASDEITLVGSGCAWHASTYGMSRLSIIKIKVSSSRKLSITIPSCSNGSYAPQRMLYAGLFY